MGRRRMPWGRMVFRAQLGLQQLPHAPRRKRVCARCGFPTHLAGPLLPAVPDGTRWLCRDREACARRRVERELHELPTWIRRLHRDGLVRRREEVA